MSSIKKYKHSQWHLVTAVSISFITLLFIVTLLHNSIISAAANGTAVNPQNLAAPSHTILVGMAVETTGPAKAASSSAEFASLAAIAPDAVQAESLLSFEKLAANTSQLGQIYKVHLRSDDDIDAVIRQLEANPAILFAEPDYLARLIATPNDSLYNDQWGLAQINAPTAWDVTTGSSNVVIAVIDSGMDMTHPDLAGQLWTNPGEIAGNGLDDDNNGYIDDVHGWNLVDDNANLSDNTGHGTEVAGVIGAASNNGQGIAGVCWNCRLMVLKVTQSGGIANYSDIIEAIQYATLKGADVVNLSLGGNSDSISLKLAVEQAAATAVVVGGAGNDDSDVPFYPAAYESVLAVAGTTASDTKVSSSNYGSWIDVTAPGETIMTTFDGGSYGMSSGTSMAAPFAAGLAGLLRSAHPDWSADTARAQMMQTATAVDTVNPGLEGLLGDGRIDAAQALTIAAQPALSYASHEVDGVVNGRPEPGSTFDLNVALSNDWADASNVQATLSSADSYITIVENSASYGNIDTFNQAANLTPFRVTVSGSAPYAHELALTLNVTADGGYSTAVPVTMTTASGTEYVSGLIVTDEFWTSDKTYVVTGNILVSEGITLTIEPGTVVKFQDAVTMRIDGKLVAVGTPEKQILITSSSNNPTSGLWQGLEFTQKSVAYDSIIEYAQIEFASTAVKANYASPTIRFSKILHNRTGIWCWAQMENGFTPVLIIDNLIANNDTGIYVQAAFDGIAKINHNRIIDNLTGIFLDNVNSSEIIYNLIEGNTTGIGGDMGTHTITVISNTITNNSSVGILTHMDNVVNNNFVNNPYHIQNTTSQNVNATNNWWETSDTNLIDQHIYDFLDDFNLGTVIYAPILTKPEPDAPAYLHNLTVSPESPIGIETATFNLQFSRPMDQSVNPLVIAHWDQSGSKLNYTSANSGILGDYVTSLAIDSSDNKWFADLAGVSQLKQDGTWTTYTSSNSGLASSPIGAAAVDSANNKWFGSSGGYGNDAIVSKLAQNGVWTTYDNTGLTDSISRIVPDTAGNVWFASTWNAAKLNNDGTWTMYSFYPDYVRDIAIDQQNNVWFAFDETGVKVLSPTGIWSSYTTLNSGLDSDKVFSIAIDEGDNKWIGTNIGLNLLTPEGTWTKYLSINDGVISVRSIDLDLKDNVWFFGEYAGIGGSGYHLGKITPGTPAKDNDWSWNYAQLTDWVTDLEIDSANNIWLSTINGASVILREVDFSISDNNGTWINDAVWQANFDINALVPRSVYSITVTSARGTDGMVIPTNSRFSFTVDYAGEITDQTAPEPPFALAGGIAGDASGFEALWFAYDSDSSITGYRYALGSAPGATDIINWTTTSETSLQLRGLGLVEGQRYWLAVQARNTGGLWSTSTYSGFIAGQPLSRIFLPGVMK